MKFGYPAGGKIDQDSLEKRSFIKTVVHHGNFIDFLLARIAAPVLKHDKSFDVGSTLPLLGRSQRPGRPGWSRPSTTNMAEPSRPVKLPAGTCREGAGGSCP